MFARAITAIFYCMVAVAPLNAQVQDPVDLYVFAGQSNMRGHVSTLSKDAFGPALIPAPYQQTFALPVDWARQWDSSQVLPKTTDAETGAWGSNFVAFRAGYDPQTKQKTGWGPEVAFLYNRYQVDGRPIHFVKYAIGGATVWLNPTKANWNAAATGNSSLADALAARVNNATAALLASGYGLVNVRLIWAQGESDGGVSGRSYRENFAGFLSKLSNQVTRTNVSFQLDSMTLVANAASINAQAQINIAASDYNAALVNVHDYPKSLFISDNLHLGPDGQIRHGEEIELVTRTRPRQQLDLTASSVDTIAVKISSLPKVIAYLSSIMDGRYGFEMTGDMSGLTLDSLGRLRLTSPALVAPGQRTFIVTRHSVPDVQKTTLVINFYR